MEQSKLVQHIQQQWNQEQQLEIKILSKDLIEKINVFLKELEEIREKNWEKYLKTEQYLKEHEKEFEAQNVDKELIELYIERKLIIDNLDSLHQAIQSNNLLYTFYLEKQIANWVKPEEVQPNRELEERTIVLFKFMLDDEKKLSKVFDKIIEKIS